MNAIDLHECLEEHIASARAGYDPAKGADQRVRIALYVKTMRDVQSALNDGAVRSAYTYALGAVRRDDQLPARREALVRTVREAAELRHSGDPRSTQPRGLLAERSEVVLVHRYRRIMVIGVAPTRGTC